MKQVRCSPKSAFLPRVIGKFYDPLPIGNSDLHHFFSAWYGGCVFKKKRVHTSSAARTNIIGGRMHTNEALFMHACQNMYPEYECDQNMSLLLGSRIERGIDPSLFFTASSTYSILNIFQLSIQQVSKAKIRARNPCANGAWLNKLTE